MKIAIITSGLLPVPAVSGGAIETLLDSFLKQNEISDKNLDVTVYSLSNKKAKNIVKLNNYQKTKYVFINSFSNYIIRVVNKFFKSNIPINKYYQIDVVKKINKCKYDYVIVENYPELVLKIKNHKVIPYIHSDVFNNEIENSKQIFNSCYKVITVSNYIKNRVCEIDNLKSNKVYTVYNSIDLEQIFLTDKYNEYRNEIRNRYNISKNDFVYAFAGRISREKGPLELVNAFNKVDATNKKLLIIGGIWYNSNKTDSYLEELKDISNDNVIFTGYVEHSEILKILCAVDVGVVPSLCNEAAGLSIVEFMNTGNIVIASNRGGISEYLDKNNNFLIDFNSSNELINKLSSAMNNCYINKDSLNDILLKNYEFSKKFSVEDNYNKIISVLESGD